MTYNLTVKYIKSVTSSVTKEQAIRQISSRTPGTLQITKNGKACAIPFNHIRQIVDSIWDLDKMPTENMDITVK